MRRAWLVLMIGCGFQGTAAGPGDGAGSPDAVVPDPDGSPVDPSSTCWTIASTNPVFDTSACVATLGPSIEITANTQIDTDSGTSVPAGLGCAALTSGSSEICALAASSITIRSGVTLSATGSRPLALLAHAIDIQGVVDVASHGNGTPQATGPAANLMGCNPAMPALVNGGGAGGTFDGGPMADAGDGGTSPATGSRAGTAGGSIGIVSLRGGCPGGPSSGGSLGVGGAVGGHGGGAVWIATDTGTLVIGKDAIINASGAGGAGGKNVPLDRGGAGGGSGGMIVLQAPTITLPSSAKLLARGGGGGGGSAGTKVGGAGKDPREPENPADGGDGASDQSAQGGDGGMGMPAPIVDRDGDPGVEDNAGGGGGGGGAGVIRVASPTDITVAKVSPTPIQLN